MPPNLSKAQLLNFLQCPRRFWLDQYHPEHEGDVDQMDAALDAEEAAKARAGELLAADNVSRINGRLGLRNAIEQTTSLLAPGAFLLDATLEHEGISAHVDVLDWTTDTKRAILITAATAVSTRHIEDCAIQAWVMRGLGLPEHTHLVGLSVEGSASSDFESCFVLEDVSDRVRAQIDTIEAVVAQARTLHASLDEPDATIAEHCRKPGYACPFLEYCEGR